MATAIVMPKLGNTVESSIIIRWRKQPGDFVSVGEAVCEIETDKATMEAESPMGGTMLAQFFQECDDVPVMVNIDAVGTPGDDMASLCPNSAAPNASVPATPVASAATTPVQAVTPPEPNGETKHSGISPRARYLAERRDIDFTIIPGSDHGGRIIERDICCADRATAHDAAGGLPQSGTPESFARTLMTVRRSQLLKMKQETNAYDQSYPDQSR